MANSDYLRMQARLTALTEREAEIQAEWKEANERSETVRASALAGEIQRIARRRAELLAAIPNHAEVETIPRHNRGN